jgi:glycosyltransferase involved in cell wall biosynthesis
MKVSILVPLYNSQKFLKESIESMLAQTWENTEIILVDDGSRDQSLQIAESYASIYSKIKVFTQPNSGACSARNRAFLESSGEYIQYLDADDLLSPNKIEVQLKRLNGDKRSICNGRWGRFYSHDPFHENIKWGPHELLQKDLQPIDWLCRNHMSQTACWLTPRELILKAGGWDETLTQNQDGEFFTRILMSAETIFYSAEAKVFYRSNLQGSVSQKAKLELNIRSRFRTCASFEKVILEMENSERTRRAVSDKYQVFIYSAFPYHRELVQRAEQKVRHYGGSDWPPDKGGSIASFVTMLFGWKLVAWLRKILRKG